MTRRPTVGEKRVGGPAAMVALARQLVPCASHILLGFLWEAFPRFVASLAPVEISGDEEELERSLTQELEPILRDAMDDYAPFYLQHAPREFHTRLAPPAQAPEYDLGFILRADNRVIWPIEAKVLKTPTRTGEYVKEIKDNFLTCRRAPFSSEAAMIAYLLQGAPEDFFGRIAAKVPCELHKHSKFPDRPHRRSTHEREVAPGEDFEPTLNLNHLVVELRPDVGA